MLHIGIVGAGVMGATHAKVLNGAVAGAALVAVSDPDPVRAGAVAGTGGARVLSDALTLIASADVDAVVVASPDDSHLELVMACVEAGKPVLCEKPLASDSAACRTIVERELTLERRLIQVGYMRRFDPAYLDLKAALGSGSVGSPILVRCFHRNASAPSFFRAGMAISNAMVHEFDVCRWLLGGEIEAVRVDRPRRRGAPAHDPLLATLAMSGGQLVTVEVFMNAGYGYDIGTEIVGDSGVLMMGVPPTTRTVSKSMPETRGHSDFRIRFEEAYVRQMQAWTQAIIHGTPCGARAADGLSAALVAEAGERSLRSGSWEQVET